VTAIQAVFSESIRVFRCGHGLFRA